MHVVISLLLQSRKFWWYLLLTCSLLLYDVVMTLYCCQWYTECLVTTLFQQDSALAHRSAHVELLRQETPNFVASNLWPPNGPDLSPADYEIWALMQHRVYHKQIHSVDELKRRLIDVWYCLKQSIFDETIDRWWGRHLAYVHAKRGYFEYSLWTDNVDFVHICYIQCDLFDCYICNYAIMPATLSDFNNVFTVADRN